MRVGVIRETVDSRNELRSSLTPIIARPLLMRIGVLLCTLMFAICSGWPAPTIAQESSRTSATLPAGNQTIRIRFGGKNREYIIHVPSGASAPLPLLLAFHGGGGEAEGFQKYAGLDAVADREKFIVVYPYGTGVFLRRLLTWNAGDCCAQAMNNKVDDVGFAMAVIDDVIRKTRIDTKRIYATGHSNGAMMAYRLAAERAERIAAIAPVSGAYNLEKFAPSQPVAVLDIHSVDDPRALYNGGMGPAFPGTNSTSSHRAVMDGIHRWTRNNKCSGDSTVTETRTGKSGTSNAGQTATLMVWKGCAAGGEVAHWKLTGVGHGWPGDEGAAKRERIIGPQTTLVLAAEEVWKFVSKVKRP